ncbi:hypothetical protein SCP_1003060 [Sparassis crispa]|uniref:Meiotically up-regulated gene 152 protein n=1 Tax=Sparassis crispa TaxID=139825 RepID=A0A401GY25_9APHY|nr:hypothetical protein SCP_1003060 [Sparassis crispa]GBE87059.1 hypothetical protein SCP_1003060 [Sparassis crispa]
MAETPERTNKLPTSSTFSFTAPFPTSQASSSGASPSLKQRRVSLALPSSPRQFPAWSFRDDTGLGVHTAESVPEKKGKMRRIDNGADRGEDEPAPLPMEKKQRKKWSMEETQMLVAGCNKWGVGNWKSILNDPDFKFDNRSPVDLKDRFRTYFPDAYKQHYPNAKTHLSSKIRSSLPDGTSIFEKTRSKKRRPFTEEEDRALKAGYDKHGTVWATIVKDPVFQEQNRRSTDLRDRFRNAFPDLYQAAGYKPRTTTKKKKDQPVHPVRAATDDQLGSSSVPGPVRRKRRHTTQGLFRGGTKSVPESTTCSEDEDSSEGEDDQSSMLMEGAMSLTPEDSTPFSDPFTGEVDMQTLDSLAIPDFNSSSSLSEMTDSSQSQTWSSALDTPLHSGAWSAATNATSPTSPHLTADFFLNQSPFERRNEGSSNIMIGKSAWGPQDWLSPNPRLEPSVASSSNSSYVGGLSPTPSSPFSFANLNHGVLDRYDLFPASLSHDFASEVGVSDTHSTFSDPEMFAPNTFRGFTHHHYAGDLIFGARTHQPIHPVDYGPGFGFGNAGLGLSGLQQLPPPPQNTGLHPMQLHTPALPGIDEIELTSITLDDHAEPMGQTMDNAIPKTKHDSALTLAELAGYSLPTQTLEEIVGLTQEMRTTPPGTPHMSRSVRPHTAGVLSAAHNRSISVPPSEHRAFVPRAAQTQMLRPKPLLTPTRSTSLMDLLPLHPSEFDAQSLAPSSPFDTDGWCSPGEYDLPFLDLHYYKSGAAESGYGEESAEQARQGLALDLAETFVSPPKTFGVPPSLTQHIPAMSHSVGGTPPMHARVLAGHHRGQSVVSPQDLLLHKGNDNKRKRSSWDGGAS